MKELKILSIGNSFSDDTVEYLWQIAKACGVEKVRLGNFYIGGCTLDTHYENAVHDAPAYEYRTNTDGEWHTRYNARLSEALLPDEWDVISFQQQSMASGIAETFTHLDDLVAYVRGRVGENVVFAWNMTWAYQQDCEIDSFQYFQRNQATMYQMIVQTAQNVVLKNPAFSLFSPTGTAIQNARTSFLGDGLTRDGFHLHYEIGRYIAGLTYFSALTGMDVQKISYAPQGVSEAEKEVALEAVVNALNNPFSVTESKKKQGKKKDVFYKKS